MFKNLMTAKTLAMVGIGTVFAQAVYISAQHIYHVATFYGQTRTEAFLLPGILDIFGLFCAIRLRLPSISDVARRLARFGMWFALGTSLWFNLESALITSSGANQTITGKSLFISAVPAIIVWAAAEILTHVRKVGSTKIGLFKKIIHKIFKIKPTPSTPRAVSPKPEATPKAASKPSKTSAATKVTAPRQRKAPVAETLSEAPAIS